MSTFPKVDTIPLPTPQPKPTRWQLLKRLAKDHLTPSHYVVKSKFPNSDKIYKRWDSQGWTNETQYAFVTYLFLARIIARMEQDRLGYCFWIVTVERVEEL